MSLSKGKHTIKVTFFEQSLGNILHVHYQGPGFGKMRIPDSALGGGSSARTVADNPQGGHSGLLANPEMPFDIDIRMYPNPASEYLTVSNAPDAAYSIIGLSGKVMLQGTLSNTQRLDVSSLPNGIYIVKVQLEREQLTERILIQH